MPDLNPRRGRCLLVGLALLCLSPLASAQEEKRPGQPGAKTRLDAEAFRITPVDKIALPTDAEAGREVPLSLEEALRFADERNVDLSALRLVPQRSQQALISVLAGFDSEIYSEAGYRSTVEPSTSPFRPETDRDLYDAQIGWRKRAMVTNGSFDVNYAWNRVDQTVTGVSGFPDVLHDSSLNVSYTQPLLRSAWSEYAQAGVRRAESELQQSRFQFQQSRHDILLSVVRAYWELVFAREDYKVQYQALELAQLQLNRTRARIAARDLAPRDAVADEAEVARRTEARITAENNIRQRQDELRTLLFRDTDPDMWQLRLSPTSPIPSEQDVSGLDWQKLAKRALVTRPELLELRSAVDAARQDLIAADGDLWPQLDLVGSYNTGSSRDRYPDAWDDTIDQEYPDWSVRLLFSYPLGNRAARSRQQQARLFVEESRRRVVAREMGVRREVREAVRNLQTLRESIRAAEESVRLALSDLDTAQRRQRVGTLTMFDVQERNQQLVEARSRLLRNQLDFRVAEAVLRHAQGLPLRQGEEADPGASAEDKR